MDIFISSNGGQGESSCVGGTSIESNGGKAEPSSCRFISQAQGE